MDSIGIDESRLLNAAINLSRAPNNQITNGLVNQLFIFAKKNTDAPIQHVAKCLSALGEINLEFIPLPALNTKINRLGKEL